MFDFFFYGTLIDPDIREMVLGRPIDAVGPASLGGYRRYPVVGEPYPAAVPDPGGRVDGVLAEGLSVAEAAALSRFEGSGYDATQCLVELPGLDESQGHAAWVFVAGPSVPLDQGEWSVEVWARDHKAQFVALADTWLKGAGGRTGVDSYEAEWRGRL